ncbi:MAG: MATE family efflux transporter, partial [Blautia sp.]|nr:MATE family efflux transporter [Blautia sp.]
VSAIMCAHKLYSMKALFDMKSEYIRWNQRYAMGIIKLGIPSGITQAIISMSMIAVQSLTNSFGEIFIAANVVVMRVDGFAMLPNFSFGTAMTTYAGQNVGAKQLDRVSQGAKQGTILALSCSAVITGAILLFGKHLMGIFTNTPELVELSMKMMSILAVGYIAMAVLQSLSGVMRGAGDTMTPMWISIVQTVCLRVPLAYLMCYLTRSAEYPNGRQECIFISLLAAWLLATAITCIFYVKGNWKNKAVTQ